MTRTISQDTQAILLLYGRFGERQDDAAPLTLGEYGRLVSWLRERELRPSELLERGASSDLTLAKLDPARIDALLKRGAALALVTEKWLRSGLWIISRGDEIYLGRLKKKLGLDAPALLYGAGHPQLLDVGGRAIVVSRDVSEETLEFTDALPAAALLREWGSCRAARVESIQRRCRVHPRPAARWWVDPRTACSARR